jgi:hypothetical protein
MKGDAPNCGGAALRGEAPDRPVRGDADTPPALLPPLAARKEAASCCGTAQKAT